MLRSFGSIPRRQPSIVLTGLTLCSIALFLLLQSGSFHKARHWLKIQIKTVKGTPHLDPSLPKYYDWNASSEFSLVDNARNASTRELCAAFPTHLLESIQPVLKTGHAMLEERLRVQLESVSACLDKLLIVSDLDESYQGHELHDVIADIPSSLAQGKRAMEQLRPYTMQKELARNGSLASLNTTSLDLKGWKTDKFKFLTTIDRIWKLRPNQRWYVFFEDDGYIFWENMFTLLSHFDPDEPWYFGSPSPGCYTQENTLLQLIDNSKVWFANGGAGFVLSRGAMQKLLGDSSDPESGKHTSLQGQFWETTLDNCCGDSVLGCVLWRKDVTLSGLYPMFNVHSPHKMPFSNKIWCQPALTMHRPSEADIRAIWRWEWEVRNLTRPILWRDLAVSYWKFKDLTTQDNWSNKGRGGYKAPDATKHYSHDPHKSFESCQRACEAMPKCLQWTFHRRKCTLGDSLRYGEYTEPDVIEDSNEENWERNDLKYTAGWSQKKVRKWIDARPCEDVKWLRPSLDRIY